jgi:phosphatidylserine/phosphatidylglycerophosphate/cardiolipin synthase-like enzyme
MFGVRRRGECDVTTSVKVYVNEDDALLFWSVSEPIPGCRGFAISRRRSNPSGLAEGFLLNRMGFENQPVPTPGSGGAVARSSTEWPFQRFSWTDHDADTGDTVSYRVVPVVRDSAGTLELVEAQASPWSPERTLGVTASGGYQPFFNRAFVISQFMARYLAERQLTLDQFKTTIAERDETTIRRFLSGDLRLALISEIRAVAEHSGQAFAALFELSDEELLDELCALGGRAHVVLANGSIQKATGETTTEARRRDENATARAKLEAAGVDVEHANRFISPGALGHNKFLVRTDTDGTARTVWTGSTNWTPTGLCTQVNNGLLITDPDVAAAYRQQWQRLRDAASGFPRSLVDHNSTPTRIGPRTPGGSEITVWFTRTARQVDLDALRAEVNAARQGILFLMFMPGATGLFSTVAGRAADPGLYVRGVVSELPRGQADEDGQVHVNLIDGATQRALNLDIIQPEGIAHPLANFAAEVTRKQFLAHIGHAIIHSKIIVTDPFSANSTVIAGSHNFSLSASGNNDENFVIIKNAPELAEAYAVNILGAYAHYRWRAFLSQQDSPFNGLKDNDTWMAPKLARDQRELHFWRL